MFHFPRISVFYHLCSSYKNHKDLLCPLNFTSIYYQPEYSIWQTKKNIEKLLSWKETPDYSAFPRYSGLIVKTLYVYVDSIRPRHTLKLSIIRIFFRLEMRKTVHI